MEETLKRTGLWETHVALNARMVPFAGWDMPVQYSGILAEARAVRSKAGIFDVSHMGRLYISGLDATGLMDHLVTTKVTNLRYGAGRYAMICNEDGGIIDDTVFYRVGEQEFLLICNAGNHVHVLPWILDSASRRFPRVTVDDRTETAAMIALQGPSSLAILDFLSHDTLSGIRPFTTTEGKLDGKPAFIARTGYTGEDGFELIVPGIDAPSLWAALIEEGATPCGLGARDVLRLEAGLALHGNDIDTSTTPLEAGLNRFAALDKDFSGANALRRQNEAGISRRLVGLNVDGRSIARHGSAILASGDTVGEVTSGTLSPTLDRSIAMGYVLVGSASPGQRLQVDIRGKLSDAEVTLLPFYSRKATK